MTQPVDDVQAVSRMLEPAGSAELRTLAVERTYPTDVADLWEAVTDADRLARWMAPVSGDLRVGGRYQIEGNAGGTVQACEPPSSYALSWEWDGETSYVRVSVRPSSDGGATLRIEHDAPPNEHWERFGPAATGIGWEGALRGLSIHVVTGERVDPEAAIAWESSDEGVAWLQQAGREWARAAETAGDDPRWARDAADRTVAFYSGAG